jgi:hypothetical protein
VKRTGRDEPTGVVIHICMETTQGHSLCSYLLSQTSKNAMFLFLSFMVFSSTKLQERRVKEVLLVGGRGDEEGLALAGGER